MRYTNAHFRGLLAGVQCPERLLCGRGFRKDARGLFAEAGERGFTWYKTFAARVEGACQEAYDLLGLRLDSQGVITDAGALSLCLGEAPEDAGADVDDPAAFRRVLDILPLDGSPAARQPAFLAHEAGMLAKGRWLPEGFEPYAAPLPAAFTRCCLPGSTRKAEGDLPILEELHLDLDLDAQAGVIEGQFGLRSNRGARNIVCLFGGVLSGGVWRIDQFGVESHAAAGLPYAGQCARFAPLVCCDSDRRQAELMLVDCYSDAQFQGVLCECDRKGKPAPCGNAAQGLV